MYREIEYTTGESKHDLVAIPFGKPGDYKVKVIPEAGASPTDTYTLEVTQNGETTILAQNQQIQNIPSQPFKVKVPLQVKIDIKPGSGPNCINPTSKGTTTVAVLGKDVDVTAINVGTIRIDGDSNPATIGISPVSVKYGDVDGDRKRDLVLQFSTLQLNGAGMLSDGKTLYITGERTDGLRILGSDLIFLAGGPNCS